MNIIYIGSVFCALITAISLLKSQTIYQAFSDRLLAAFLITSGYCVILYLLIITGNIVSFPHLFKTAAPLNFILPPLSYLYVRSVLNNEVAFSRKDIFHFIPFLIIFFNYLPFYFSSAEYKLDVIQGVGAIYWKGTGFINEKIGFILRELQAFIYLLFQWLLILRFKKQAQSIILKTHEGRVQGWLYLFSSINLVFFVCLLFSAILTFFFKKDPIIIQLLQASDILFGTGYLTICSYLLINPSVLYGLPYLNRASKAPEKIIIQQEEAIVPHADYELLSKELTRHFEEKQLYLQKNLSLSQVSVSLDISPRNISFLLNSHIGLRFNDFVNGYRLKYVLQKIEEGYLEEFTLDSLSKEAGFSNYRTFHRAFQKAYVVTPIEYIEQGKSAKKN